MQYRYEQVLAPVNEPVTVAEVKDHLRISGTDDDSYLGTLISTVRKSVEHYTGLSLITQTWKVFFDRYPVDVFDPWWSGVREIPENYYTRQSFIELKRHPVQSVTHIKTYDDDDTATTFDSDKYRVATYSGNVQPARISLKSGHTWPTFTRGVDGVEVQYVAGFGDNASDVPEPIRHAILEEIAFHYENRGDVKNTGVSQSTKALLAPYKGVSL